MTPIDIANAPIQKGAAVSKGQNWIEFYSDAEEDIPPDMLTPIGEEAFWPCTLMQIMREITSPEDLQQALFYL